MAHRTPSALALAFAASLSSCRTAPVAPPAETRAIETALAELYRAFSFEAGGEADWQAIRELSAEGAVFVSPIAPGAEPEGVGIDEFLREFRAWVGSEPVRDTGLEERIVRARIDVFGTIAHAWVAFDAVVPGASAAPRRGLDSIQLVLDGDRWRLVSFTTQYEPRPGTVPERFL